MELSNIAELSVALEHLPSEKDHMELELEDGWWRMVRVMETKSGPGGWFQGKGERH